MVSAVRPMRGRQGEGEGEGEGEGDGEGEGGRGTPQRAESREQRAES